MTFRLCKVKSALLSAAVCLLVGAVTLAMGSIFAGTVSAAAGHVLGDANNDGEVTIDDVTCIQRVLAEWDVGDGYDESAADVDGNGTIEINDATYLQMWLADLEPPYPIGAPIEEPTEATETQPTATQTPTDADGWGRVVYRP